MICGKASCECWASGSALLPPYRVIRRSLFSSRRRHTRFDCDWSSDVCSSDLFERVGSANYLHGSGNGAGQSHGDTQDRKSTRLNSSHSQISYAVFCLKKKKNKPYHRPPTTRR